jgi:predicted HicB family RNase H-like nuclease
MSKIVSPKKANNQLLSVRVSDTVLKQVKTASKEQNISQGEYVRIALSNVENTANR